LYINSSRTASQFLVTQTWLGSGKQLLLVDDGLFLTRPTLVDQPAVPDHGVTVLAVVDVDVSIDTLAVEKLGLAGQVSLDRGEAVERCRLEVVAPATVGAAGAAASVGRLVAVGVASLTLPVAVTTPAASVAEEATARSGCGLPVVYAHLEHHPFQTCCHVGSE
jgi:hypothetical protein